MNDTNDDIHPDIDLVLMDHVDYKEHMKATRFDIIDFLEEKGAQYTRKPKEVCVDTIQNKIRNINGNFHNKAQTK
jgi:hypothetical protein